MIGIVIVLKVLIVIVVVLITHANSKTLHDIFIFLIMLTSLLPWRHDVLAISTTKLHLTESELKFCEV